MLELSTDLSFLLIDAVRAESMSLSLQTEDHTSLLRVIHVILTSRTVLHIRSELRSSSDDGVGDMALKTWNAHGPNTEGDDDD